MRKIILIFSAFIVFIIGIILLLSTIGENEEVNIHFLGINDADAIIIETINNIVMIDTGRRRNQEEIISKLESLNVGTINYLILTHPDNDHIGNASYLIENYNVLNVIQSAFYRGTELQQELNDTIKSIDLNNIIVENIHEFSVDNLYFTIYPAPSPNEWGSNNNSLVTIVTYDKINMFFGGDIQRSRTEVILTYDLPRIHLMKMPHHGRYNGASSRLINTLRPEHAVITSDVIEERMEDALNSIGSLIHVTKDTNISFTTNGRIIRVN